MEGGDEYNTAQVREECRGDALKVHAYVASGEEEDCDDEQTICVNTLAAFVQANRLVCEKFYI